jgi:hypothetical protein
MCFGGGGGGSSQAPSQEPNIPQPNRFADTGTRTGQLIRSDTRPAEALGGTADASTTNIGKSLL